MTTEDRFIRLEHQLARKQADHMSADEVLICAIICAVLGALVAMWAIGGGL